MTKNRTPTPVYLDPGMHPGLEVKGLRKNKFRKLYEDSFFLVINSNTGTSGKHGKGGTNLAHILK